LEPACCPDPSIDDGIIWFVYDGECPICRTAAKALRIREAVGKLATLDARTSGDHPLMTEIRVSGIDLDRGMVIRYGGRLVTGDEALVLMAVLGTGTGWFNRLNALLFARPRMAKIGYPLLRAGRNASIRLLGIDPIRNLD
jgi:predicted DCC family thiol-disulfide oxidoreductase YuxK